MENILIQDVVKRFSQYQVGDTIAYKGLCGKETEGVITEVAFAYYSDDDFIRFYYWIDGKFKQNMVFDFLL